MDISKLKALIPESVYEQLPAVIERYHINTNQRIAHFLAQCAHESLEFQKVYENLNYSGARLLEIFPRYFDAQQRIDYAHKAERIANRVYANRMGNGDEFSGDGFKFRGRGYLQLTGRSNYEKFDLEITESIVASPDLVATRYPLFSAAWYWNEKALNIFADANDIKTITRKINGGLNGFDDRVKHFDRYYGAL